MNRFGTMAMEHWRRWVPTRMAMIPPEEREEFFTRLGEQVAEQITLTEEALLSTLDLNGVGYLETVGRLSAIRRQAEELVLTELVWIDPEPGTDPNDELLMEPAALDPLAEWVGPDGMPRDTSHPLWAMWEDESVSPEEFLQHLRTWLASLPRE